MAAKLGDRVKDIVTGFEGILVARTKWLHGCDRLTIEPDKLDDKGMPQEAHNFDEQRIEVLEERNGPPVAEAAKKVTRTGGPQNDRAALRRP